MQRYDLYDYTRQLYYYYDYGTSTYIYANGLRVPAVTPATASVGSNQAQAVATTSQSAAGHGHNAVDTSSSVDFADNFSRLSVNHINTAPDNLAVAPYPINNYTLPQYGYHQNIGVNAAVPNPYATNVPISSRPSDGELLENVGREVVLHPDASSTPPDFPLLSQGRWPRRILRGSERHGTSERLKPSFQIQYPGYNFYKRGVVFRVLWPELAGDVKQDITIATTGAFGEKTYYKIRWFVVIREGHNCCTCLSIQTYGGRGVPENKPNNHHAIMYTGKAPPRATASEIVPTEPPMGQPIRVIGKEPWNTMDPKSRVNFLKLYTVEHNVKVEDFGHVDPNDEWTLMAQFKSHWGIEDAEPLPPARHTKFYDGHTFGPAPTQTRQDSFTESSQAPGWQTGYGPDSTTPKPTVHNPEPYRQYQSLGTSAYASPGNATYEASNYPSQAYPSSAAYQVPGNQLQPTPTFSYPHPTNMAYMASQNPAYVAPSTSHYASPNSQRPTAQYAYVPTGSQTQYTPATNSNADLYEDDRRTPRARRPSDTSSGRSKQQHESLRRR